ncbi:MAG: ABC transporter permease [Candidatus Sumerlaeota bacterium]|nr:ABC transporter permease [Candidatus Sumerlaeota bacterium]
MFVTANLKIGMKEIWSHKLRSFLTMLGVIFGVAAVVAMVAIAEGAKEEALRQIRLLGTNNIRIRKQELKGIERTRAMRKSPDGLTRADAASLREILADVTNIAVSRTVSARLLYKNEIPPCTVVGVSPGYPEVVGHAVQEGRFISDLDEKETKQVCAIGQEIKNRLFPLEEPLNRQVRLEGQLFTVIGVMEKKSSDGGIGSLKLGNLNQNIYIPITTAFKRFGQDERAEQLDEISLKLLEGADLQELAHVVKRILLRRHNDVEDFEIVIPEELLRQSQRTQRIFTIVLTAIAGISLIVGGIGIMNIMLATVTQRTREIGIRRAIGATERHILLQFLIESLTLSLVGGFIGIFAGVGMAKAIALYAQWKTPISILSIIVSFSVAAITGLGFGLYPSMKAAHLDPIEALRYE